MPGEDAIAARCQDAIASLKAIMEPTLLVTRGDLDRDLNKWGFPNKHQGGK